MDISHVFSGARASFSRRGCGKAFSACFMPMHLCGAYVCLACVLVPGIRAGAQTFPYLKYSTTGIDDLVPMTVVREAVRQRAVDRWAKYAIGEPIPCADENGLLVCWQVPVALDAERFPDSLVVPSAEEIGNDDLSGPRWWGVSQYWTFVVSASYSDYPIFVHYQGLPPVWVTSRLAAEKAKHALGVASVELIRYVFLGQPGAYYVFAGSDGRKISIDADTIQELVPAKSRPVPGDETSSPFDKSIETGKAAYRIQTQEAWADIRVKALRKEDLP